MTHVNDTHGQRNDLGAQPPKTYNGDIRQLPPALEHLRDEKVWVIWCWEWNGKKWTKEPYRTDKPSKHASSSDPDTWGTHGQAWAQVHSGNADGIGFTLQGRGIGTVDLDDCRDLETGDIAPWAQEIVDQFPGAYVEITVSGTGLRIIGTSDLKDFAPKHRDKGVEFFSNCNFYNTLSCNALVSPAALLPIGDKMKALDARLKGAASHQSGNGAAGGPNVFELFGDSKSPKAAPEEWSQKREDYIRAALDAIPTDETTLKTKYDPHMVWHDIGRGLDRLGWGERGYAMWREWCRRAPEYNEEGLRKNWVSFAKHRDSREEQITVKRIFDYAIAFGWVPPEEKESQSRGKITLIDLSNWDNVEVPEQEWIAKDRIPAGAVTLFSGEGAGGKSLIELQRGVAHVLGRDWYGTTITQGSTLIIEAEDPEKVIHKRLADILDHYEAKFADIAGKFHVASLAGDDAVLAVLGRKSGKIEPTPRYKHLLEMAGDLKPVSTTLLASADMFAGNEIDRSQVQQFIAMLTRVAIVAAGGLVLVSHPSLTGIASGSGISGSTQWHNSVRARFYVKAVAPNDGEEPDTSLRIIEFKKNNYGPVTESIPLRYENGLFLPVSQSTADQAARELEAERVFMDLLAQLTDQKQDLSVKPKANNYAPTVMAVQIDAKGFRKAELAAAMQRLLKADKVHVAEAGYKSKPRQWLVAGPRPKE